MLLTLPTQQARRWPARIVALTAIGLSLLLDLTGLLVIPLLFVLVVPFEKLFPRHRAQRVRRPLLTLDMTYALALPVMNVIGVVAAIVIGMLSLAWIPGILIRPLVSLVPSAALPFVGIVLFDLAMYWAHRWSHEVPALWRAHSVHHSPEQLDWISGFRAHPFDGAIVAPPFIFLITAGFDATFTGVLALIQIGLGLFLHANVRWRLRPLHRLFVTPEFHHWHHANETDARNTNYSVFLPIWDIAFGTYYMPRNKRPLKYGISEALPATMAGQFVHPLRGMPSPLAVVRHPWRSLRDGWRSVRRIATATRRATFRPRVTQPRRGQPCLWALDPPVPTADGSAPTPPMPPSLQECVSAY